MATLESRNVDTNARYYTSKKHRYNETVLSIPWLTCRERRKVKGIRVGGVSSESQPTCSSTKSPTVSRFPALRRLIIIRVVNTE